MNFQNDRAGECLPALLVSSEQQLLTAQAHPNPSFKPFYNSPSRIGELLPKMSTIQIFEAKKIVGKLFIHKYFCSCSKEIS